MALFPPSVVLRGFLPAACAEGLRRTAQGIRQDNENIALFHTVSLVPYALRLKMVMVFSFTQRLSHIQSHSVVGGGDFFPKTFDLVLKV
jgi:hypothetical protein